MRRNWAEARRKCEAEPRCRVCKRYDLPLQAAHIIPRSLGGGQCADAIVPLCQSCHGLYDSHNLDILPYLSKDEQAEAVRVVGMTRALKRITGER